MKTIKQNYEMNASPDEVFKALTDPKIIKVWSGMPAKMDAKEGTKFSLWGGDMFGTNKEVVKNKKLVQEWCTKTFKSKTIFTIKPKGTKTIVGLVHEGVPDKSYKNYADGWEQYYLGAMRKMFSEKT